MHTLIHSLFCFLLLTSSALAQDIAQLRQGALQGNAWDQLNLGAAYDNGILGLTADPAKAVSWYRKAAAQGVAEAQFNLAHCLATGHGAELDYTAARHWMQLAAQQNMADAQYLYGVMLSEGLGGGKEPLQARHWLQRAAAQGQLDAAEYLRQLAADLPAG